MKLLRRSGPKPLSLSERLYRRFALKYHGRYLITDLQLRAKSQSLDYIEAHMRDAMILRDRWNLLLFAAREAPAQGLMLEFGVADGASVSYLAKRIARDWHGFDSFEGLPEHWSGTEAGKGTFGRGGALPNVPANVTLPEPSTDTVPKPSPPGWTGETSPPGMSRVYLPA